jgi:RNA polymerase sigma factor (sigma-70 family)
MENGPDELGANKMAAAQLNNVLRHVRCVLQRREGAGTPDADLLKRYAGRGDEAAFEALLRKHGPMVLGVCRRVLHNPHDAEDAFQATFLVLVRKASSLRSPGRLGNWLYGVAYRTALHARQAAVKRRVKEAAMATRTEATQDTWAELLPILDRELERLPEKYRAAVVLCDLQGKTRSEAALYLGCAEGTVASRLVRGRALLAERLTRHGLSITAAVLAGVLSQTTASAGVPPSLVASTMGAASVFAGRQAGAGVLPAEVAALTDGVLKVMLLGKLKVTLAVLLVLGAATLACGVLARGQINGRGDGLEKPAAKGEERPKAAKGDEKDLLTVTAVPQKVQVRVEEPFDVRLRVVNSSRSTQSLRVMNCSWDEHWKSSNGQVSWVGWNCAKNFAVTEKLEPGEVYEKTLPMLLLAGGPQRKVSFRMGFTPIGSKRTYWSNEVTVQPAREAQGGQGKDEPPSTLKD